MYRFSFVSCLFEYLFCGTFRRLPKPSKTSGLKNISIYFTSAERLHMCTRLLIPFCIISCRPNSETDSWEFADYGQADYSFGGTEGKQCLLLISVLYLSDSDYVIRGIYCYNYFYNGFKGTALDFRTKERRIKYVKSLENKWKKIFLHKKCIIFFA